MRKSLIAAAFMLFSIICFGQEQCLCNFGYPLQSCVPDSVIDLPSGLQIAVCGTVIHTIGGTFFTNLTLSYCGNQSESWTEEMNFKNEASNPFDTFQVIVDHDTIGIITMKWLPVGENFDFSLLPLFYHEFYRDNDYFMVAKNPAQYLQLLADNIKPYSDSKIQKVWHIYDDMKLSNSPADKRLAGILFIAAISGSEDLEHKLISLKEQFKMDNDTNIYYEDLVELLSLWKNRKE